MGFWGTAACTCLRSQWNNSLINIHQTQRLFVFILSTRENWLDHRGRIIHFMPFSSLVLCSWLFSLTLNDPWLERAKMKLLRGNRHPPHLWLPLTLICTPQRKTTAIMSLFPAWAIKAYRAEWREIRGGEWTEDWIGQSFVVKLFVFLCQDKREINRRYWCWARGSLVS